MCFAYIQSWMGSGRSGSEEGYKEGVITIITHCIKFLKKELIFKKHLSSTFLLSTRPLDQMKTKVRNNIVFQFTQNSSFFLLTLKASKEVSSCSFYFIHFFYDSKSDIRAGQPQIIKTHPLPCSMQGFNVHGEIILNYSLNESQLGLIQS